MKKYFILLAGSPGTGKTCFMNKLREQSPGMYAVTPSEIKEYYVESIGFNNLEERAEQGRMKVYPFYYKALDLYMEAGEKVIVSEYPFNDKQKARLQELADRYGYQVITVRLAADFGVLCQRRYKRDHESDRHLSYIMDHYHYGDVLKDRTRGTDHTTKEAFKKIIADRKYDKFQLRTLYEFDAVDYTQVGYTSLLDRLGEEVNDNK